MVVSNNQSLVSRLSKISQFGFRSLLAVITISFALYIYLVFDGSLYEFLAILFVYICLIGFSTIFLFEPIENEDSSFTIESVCIGLNRFWIVGTVFIVVTIVDLMNSINLHLSSDFDLAVLRSVFLTTEDFRSFIGRFFGSFFMAYVAISGTLYVFARRFRYLLVPLILSVIFSLLMGGRGQIILFSLIMLLPIYVRHGYKGIIFLTLIFSFAVSYIYVIRTVDSDDLFATTIIEYIVTSWKGIQLLFSGWPSELSFIKFGPEDDISSYDFAIFNGRGNVYGFFGNSIYSFGLIGAFLYFIVVYLAHLYILKSAHTVVCKLSLLQLTYTFAVMSLFCDLITFYVAYPISIIIIYIMDSRFYSLRKCLHS